MLIAFGQSITAQTYYYRYTKSIINGVTDTNVSGGQFITFDGKKCFESDKYGNNVGNGSMAYEANYSRQLNLEIYWGACFHGKNAYMKFNADRSVMEIETNTGKFYVYKRATAPANVTTCSLIREPEREPKPAPEWQQDPPVYQGQPYNPQVTDNPVIRKDKTDKEPMPRPQPKPRQKQEKWCRICNGSGKCKTCNGDGWVNRIGIGHDGYCTSCPNHNGLCSSCNGRGKWYE